MTQKHSDFIKEAVAADLRRDFWYRAGEATFNPTLPDMREPRAIEDHILAGWMPPEPFINPRTRVTFIGCCFGSSLLDHVKTLDYSEPGDIDTQFMPISETLSTSFAMRQMFEWQFEGVKPDRALVKGNRLMEINFSDELWMHSLDRLADTDVFILMISSAEIWYDEPSGGVTWRETPGAHPTRQKFRTSTFEENRANLRTIYDVVRRHRPQAKIILMLSPIPMIATHRPQSCIVANTVSKAVIRAAMDEVWREVAEEGHLLYCPFYEVIQEGFGANPYGGHYNGDRRHINDQALDYLIRLFEAYYCQVRTMSRPVLQAYVAARVSTADLPADVAQTMAGGDPAAIRALIEHYAAVDDQPMADLVALYAAGEAPEFVYRTDRTAVRIPIEPKGCGARPVTAASAADDVRPPSPAAIVEDDEDWKVFDLLWQGLPSLEYQGYAPRVLTMPDVAWDYGASSAVVRAREDADLLLRLRLRALDGVAGVMLIRPDGSPLPAPEHRVSPEDGWVAVELRLRGQDGHAHILLRNFDCDGVAVQVEVQEVSRRWAEPAAS
jgi:GSCFA family